LTEEFLTFNTSKEEQSNVLDKTRKYQLYLRLFVS
jgi:hypothetical protein